MDRQSQASRHCSILVWLITRAPPMILLWKMFPNVSDVTATCLMPFNPGCLVTLGVLRFSAAQLNSQVFLPHAARKKCVGGGWNRT